MEALFDFGFTVIKVYLVSYLYVKLYSFLTNRFRGIKFISIFPKVKSKDDFRRVRVVITVLLILYSFTYFGNKGYGDEGLIPIGYNKHIQQINGIQAYIEPERYSYGALNIENFQINDNLVFGESVSSTVDTPLPYFIWNFKTEDFIFFKDKSSFEKKLNEKNITNYKLKSFRSNYFSFWNVRIFLMA